MGVSEVRSKYYRYCVANYRRAGMRRAFMHDTVWSLGTAISQGRPVYYRSVV